MGRTRGIFLRAFDPTLVLCGTFVKSTEDGWSQEDSSVSWGLVG